MGGEGWVVAGGVAGCGSGGCLLAAALLARGELQPRVARVGRLLEDVHAHAVRAQLGLHLVEPLAVLGVGLEAERADVAPEQRGAGERGVRRGCWLPDEGRRARCEATGRGGRGSTQRRGGANQGARAVRACEGVRGAPWPGAKVLVEGLEGRRLRVELRLVELADLHADSGAQVEVDVLALEVCEELVHSAQVRVQRGLLLHVEPMALVVARALPPRLLGRLLRLLRGAGGRRPVLASRLRAQAHGRLWIAHRRQRRPTVLTPAAEGEGSRRLRPVLHGRAKVRLARAHILGEEAPEGRQRGLTQHVRSAQRRVGRSRAVGRRLQPAAREVAPDERRLVVRPLRPVGRMGRVASQVGAATQHRRVGRDAEVAPRQRARRAGRDKVRVRAAGDVVAPRRVVALLWEPLVA